MKDSMDFDLIVIGAGPAGAALAKMVAEQGFKVKILEKSLFPRFTIGESLLPQCMTSLEKCGLLASIPEDLFQIKKGALFARGNHSAKIDFSQKFSDGPSQTWQVTRADFDQILIDAAKVAGCDVSFESEITDIELYSESVKVSYKKDDIEETISSRFIVDASGGAMVLPGILGTSSKPTKSKKAVFSHFKTDHRNTEESENILIAVHPENPGIWYWGIPLKDGSISVGIVSDSEIFSGNDSEDLLKFIAEEPQLNRRIDTNSQSRDAQSITAYAATVSSTHGDRYLLIGNAAGFIDPIFSSGVTLALKSALLGAPMVIDILNGKSVNWESFDDTMRIGNNTFKAYVEAWYDSTLQDIIFMKGKNPDVQKKINSILAGYVWDINNPFVREPERKLKQVHKLFKMMEAG